MATVLNFHGGDAGITVTPQLLQQLNEASHPTQGMPQVMYQPQAPSQVSMGVPVHTNGLPVSHMPAPVGNPTPMMSAAPVPHQGVHHFQAPQPTSSFAPAATSAFSSLPYPHGSSAFTPAGSGHLSGLHQVRRLMLWLCRAAALLSDRACVIPRGPLIALAGNAWAHQLGDVGNLAKAYSEPSVCPRPSLV